MAFLASGKAGSGGLRPHHDLLAQFPFPVGEGADPRGDRRAPGRGLRRRGVQADDHRDHRPGDGRDGVSGRPGRWTAVYPVVVHRRDPREDPRRARSRPARLRGPGGHRRGSPRDPGAVGRRGRRRRRRGRGRWLASSPRSRTAAPATSFILVRDGLKGLPEAVRDRLATTIVQTCVAHPLRELVPLRRPPGLGQDCRASQAHPHPTEEAALDRFAEFADTVGETLPGRSSGSGTERVGRVRSVPGQFDRRDPQDHLHDQRDRVGQRPAAPRGPGPRTLPHRTGRAQVPLHGDDGPRPHRPGTRPVGHTAGRPALNAFDITFDGRLSAGRK